MFSRVFVCPRRGVGFTACTTGHMTRGGLHPGGSAFMGVCVQGGGQTPLPRDTWDTTGYGQQAGGTHPTGMHSLL